MPAAVRVLDKSDLVIGGSDAFVAADILDATVKRLQTTTGPTTLLVGAVADGEFLKRSGTSLIGSTVNTFPTFHLYADQLDNPITADWAVNALAPAVADSNNDGLTVRLFDDTTEEGVGFIARVPATAANIKLSFKSRAETAPGAARTVGLKLYERGIPDDAAVDAWSAGTVLTDIDIPTNENFQADSQTLTLAALGLTAGQTHQFELTRINPTGGTELVGDWALLELIVEFT